MEYAQESMEQMIKDSDHIFTTISTANYDNYFQAERAIVLFYVLDRSFSRAGISHALSRLELFYKKQEITCQ